MAGLSDYTADNILNYITGRTAMPSLPSVFVALYTVAPTSDSGTGGTEVTGGSYARQQVAGSVVTSSGTTSGSAVLHFATVGSWIVAGMYVFDTTAPTVIPSNTTVLSTVTGASGTVTMSVNASGAGVGNGDTIVFSAFSPASGSVGTEPSVTPAQILNNSVITFPAATANWGTVTSFGLYDASTSGNLLSWDYLGNYNWLPCTVSSASPGVVTATAHGYSASGNVVYTTKYGGQQPSFSQGNFTGLLTVASPTTDTFTVLSSGGLAVNTSSTGDGQVRGVTTQQIPNGVTASFAATTLAIKAA